MAVSGFSPQTEEPSVKGGRRRRWGIAILAGIVAVPALVVFVWIEATLNYSFSSGERAGFIQKLSHKGWLCKTYEGELAMTSMPGQSPEIFTFTVRDKAIADQVNALAGEKVALSYDQHRGVPFSCFGDTEYFVTAVKKVQ